MVRMMNIVDHGENAFDANHKPWKKINNTKTTIILSNERLRPHVKNVLSFSRLKGWNLSLIINNNPKKKHSP